MLMHFTLTAHPYTPLTLRMCVIIPGKFPKGQIRIGRNCACPDVRLCVRVLGSVQVCARTRAGAYLLGVHAHAPTRTHTHTHTHTHTVSLEHVHSSACCGS